MKMHHIILVLCFGLAFSLTHLLALQASLYWYYWWFDVVMHFWGGGLLVLMLYTITSFFPPHRPSWLLVIAMLVCAVISWEVFEWAAGLVDTRAQWVDTIHDIILGLSGGCLMHWWLTRTKIFL